jgi:hypothetical protein
MMVSGQLHAVAALFLDTHWIRGWVWTVKAKIQAPAGKWIPVAEVGSVAEDYGSPLRTYSLESPRGHRLPSPRFFVVFLSFWREIRKRPLGSTPLRVHHSLVTVPHHAIQGGSWLVDITTDDDFPGLCDQNSSYTRVRFWKVTELWPLETQNRW